MNRPTNGPRWVDKDIFTTGEAADICGVSQQTIIRCFDRGKIGGFRVPGSRFRRIPREDLLRFMKSNEIPTRALESQALRVLLIDADGQFIAFAREQLRQDGRFALEAARTGYDAGLLVQSFQPHVILLDHTVDGIDAGAVCRSVRNNEELPETKVIIVAAGLDPAEMSRLTAEGADGFVRKPFDVANLIEHIDAAMQA